MFRLKDHIFYVVSLYGSLIGETIVFQLDGAVFSLPRQGTSRLLFRFIDTYQWGIEDNCCYRWLNNVSFGLINVNSSWFGDFICF